MAIIQYDTNPDLSVDEKLQSFARSVQLALNEIRSGAGGAGGIEGLSQAQLKKLVDTQIKARNQEIYIVGTILSNTTGQNPADYLGFGTWIEWGKGKVPVGVDPSDSTFATSELQGGSKNAPMLKHTHDLGNHSHTIGNHTHQADLSVEVSGATENGGSHSHTIFHTNDTSGTQGSNFNHMTTLSTGSYGGKTNTADDHSHSFTATGAAKGEISGGSGNTGNASGNTGSWGDEESGANKNLQPYITCYMWKRTA